MEFKQILHQILKIDDKKLCIYMIHLERALERVPLINKLKEQLNIEFIEYKSVDGEQLIKEGHPDGSVEYPGLKCGAGNLGCTISHVNICKDALEKGYEYVVIFEDDCIFNRSYKDFIEYLSISIELLKINSINFDLFLLGNNSHLKFNPVSSFLSQVFEFYGTHAVLINKKFMESLLIEHDKTFKAGKVRSADDLYSKTIQNNNLLAFGCIHPEYFLEQQKGIHSYIAGYIRK
jgi:GR25 family glycosyltransferase involved in LPS biosynthesis